MKQQYNLFMRDKNARPHLSPSTVFSSHESTETDSNCELKTRQEMIHSFSTEKNVSVLIMTTDTGALGYTQRSDCWGI